METKGLNEVDPNYPWNMKLRIETKVLRPTKLRSRLDYILFKE